MALVESKTDRISDSNGNPINNGYYYVGTFGTDPTQAANQLTLYTDDTFSTTLTNPQRTDTAGRLVNDIYIKESSFSYQINDSTDTVFEGPKNRDNGGESSSDIYDFSTLAQGTGGKDVVANIDSGSYSPNLNDVVRVIRINTSDTDNVTSNWRCESITGTLPSGYTNGQIGEDGKLYVLIGGSGSDYAVFFKTYADRVAPQSSDYDNADSGLTATTIKTAIDELASPTSDLDRDGYRITNDGLIEQWLFVSVGVNTTVNPDWPTPFTEAVYNIQVTQSSITQAPPSVTLIRETTPSLASVQIKNRSTSYGVHAYIRAIGK